VVELGPESSVELVTVELVTVVLVIVEDDSCAVLLDVEVEVLKIVVVLLP
jgi:hypothetical protein